MTVDDAYVAIKNNDIVTLRAYLSIPQTPITPDTYNMLKSLMGYAITHEKDEVVKFLICEAGMSLEVWNDWFRIWAYLIKPNYKIINLFRCDELGENL